MPYRSKRQAALIHAKAAEGVPWARRFVRENKGSHVQPKRKRRKRKARRSLRQMLRDG